MDRSVDDWHQLLYNEPMPVDAPLDSLPETPSSSSHQYLSIPVSTPQHIHTDSHALTPLPSMRDLRIPRATSRISSTRRKKSVIQIDDDDDDNTL